MEPPYYVGDSGWRFSVSIEGRRLMCQVSYIERFLLVLSDTSFWSRLLKRDSPAYLKVLSRLAEELDRDPRFSEIDWYFHHEVLSGEPGAKAPVSAT